MTSTRRWPVAILDMVPCGTQATIPIVVAVGRAGIVSYAEVVSSIPAKSADPETRANIDEFIETTATALQALGGARRGKAVIILNPADPPMPTRNTVYCLVDGEPDHHAIEREIHDAVDQAAACVPRYRLRQDVQFEVFDHDHPLYIPGMGKFIGTRVTAMLEAETAGAAT
jgi:acetaldehyde dehydrogenase